jgi:LacI family transcriptional regulator
MVTSHQVARLAGVSQPTVSRALRDSPKVSEDTKARVRAAASALGYVPSATGRALSEGRSRRIGLVVTDLENQFYPHVIAPMHDQLEELGYQLVLMTESSDTGPVAERVLTNSVDGVLLATTTLDSVLPVRLRDQSVPFVYFNRTSPTVAADAVTVDPEEGAAALVRAVVELGHRRVAAVFGPRNTSTGESRETVLRAHLADAGVRLAANLTTHGPFDFDTGETATRRFLQTPALADRPTLIICGNDVVALGALHAAVELGLAVPEEVSVVGFDDLPMSRWAFVKLTTVAFDLDQMSREAARLLVARVEGRTDIDYQTVVFPTRFVRRRTLGPAPS